jgi:E3 ubiquitin-protein ligase MARCH6
VSIVREQLRPGVLAFLRDPTDPNFNPFRDLVEESVLKHTRRVVLSAMVYASLTVLLVHAPVQVRTPSGSLLDPY